MQGWEYRVEQDHNHSAAALNELGAEGWEMVSFDRSATVFKRPVEAAPVKAARAPSRTPKTAAPIRKSAK